MKKYSSRTEEVVSLWEEREEEEMILLVRRVLIPATAIVTLCKLTGEMLSGGIFFWFLPTSSATLGPAHNLYRLAFIYFLILKDYKLSGSLEYSSEYLVLLSIVKLEEVVVVVVMVVEVSYPVILLLDSKHI